MSFFHSLLASQGGGYSTPAGEAVVTVNSSKDVITGARWYGRTSMKVKDGVTIMAYREADNHSVNLDDVINVVFSDDYGATWTAKNTYLDASAVTGMPSYPANATPAMETGPGEPWLYLCPNGDLLIHMWSCDYGVTNQGTYQIRSVDGGRTWSAPALVAFQYQGSTHANNLNMFATDDDFVYNGVIYAGLREYQAVDSFSTAIRSWFIKSTDNGVTWELVSPLSAFAEVTNEFGMTYVGSNTIVAMMREFVTKAYQTRSNDFGVTWDALTEVHTLYGVMSRQRVNTRAQLKGQANWWNDPVLICNGFVHVNGGNSHPRRIAIWISKNSGVTWNGPYYMDDAGYDGGYGCLVYNPNTDEYVYTVYYAPMEDTNTDDGIVRQYNFSLDFGGTVNLTEDFTGTSIDTTEWTVINPSSADLTISQNNKLIFTRTTDTSVASATTNSLRSVDSFTRGTFAATLSRDVGFLNSLVAFQYWVDANNDISILKGTTAGANLNNAYLRIRIAGVSVYALQTTVSINNRFRIVYREDNTISFEYLDIVWVQLGTVQTYNVGVSGKLNIATNSLNTDAAGDSFSFDAVRVTDYYYDNTTP